MKAITKASTSIDDTINRMGRAYINQQWQEVMNLSLRGGGGEETNVYWEIRKSKSVLVQYPKVYLSVAVGLINILLEGHYFSQK